MGWRLPWARRLQSPCRTGESSLAAHSTAPTRPYELAGIARKPCARWQRRSSASGALLVAAAEGLEIQHLLGPPRRRLPLHCCASRAAEVEAGQLPRLVIALVTCVRKARSLYHVWRVRLLVVWCRPVVTCVVGIPRL